MSHLIQSQTSCIVKQVKTTKVSLKPDEICQEYRERLTDKIKNTHEGKIIDHGYLIPGSLNIVQIGQGVKKGSHFTGQLVFDVRYTANYYIPQKDQEITCQVITINKFGVLAQSLLFPSEVVIPRQLQNDPRLTTDANRLEALSNLVKNDLIRVKVIDFSIRSDVLIVVGLLIRKISNTDAERNLINRVLHLVKPLIEGDYVMLLNEEKVDQRSSNPIRGIIDMLNELETKIGNFDDAVKSFKAATETGADVEEAVMSVDHSYRRLVDLKASIEGELDSIQKQVIEQLRSIIDAFSNELDSFYKYLEGVHREIKGGSDGGAVLRDHEFIGKTREELNGLGLNFFDDELKNDLDNIKNKLQHLGTKAQTVTGKKKNIIWDGSRDKSGRYYGLKEIVNPYEFVDDFYEKKRGDGFLKVESRAYFKYREMDREFDLSNFDRPINTLHLAEGPGGFVHAIRDIRIGTKHGDADRYTGITKGYRFVEGVLKKDKGKDVDAAKLEQLWKLQNAFCHTYRTSIMAGEKGRGVTIGSEWLNKGTGILSYISGQKRKLFGRSGEELKHNSPPNFIFDQIDERDFYEWFQWAKRRRNINYDLLYIYDSHHPMIRDFFLPVDTSKRDWSSPYSRQLSDKYENVDLIYGLGDLDDGNVTETDLIFDTIAHRQFQGSMDIVTADGGFEDETNDKELSHGNLFFHEILWAFVALKCGGHFVLKIYDIYWAVTLELIGLLSTSFHEVYIFKPKTSRQANNEKYVVCKFYKGMSGEQLAVFRQLSYKWNQTVSQSLEYHFSDDKLVINCEGHKDWIVSNRDLLRLLKRRGVISDFDFKSGDRVEVRLEGSMLSEIKRHPYRIKHLLNLDLQNKNVVTRILKTGFDLTIRDLIYRFNHDLYRNQLSTISKAIKNFDDILICAENKDKLKELFPDMTVADNEPKLELITKMLRHLYQHEQKFLQSTASQWYDQYIGGPAVPQQAAPQ